MKLTKVTDGRWLLEIDDDVLVLSGFELAQLADTVGGQADQSELVRLEAEVDRLLALKTFEADAKIRIERLQEQNDSLREANARLDAELAGYKATRATGGPWRPADQTWVSADIEPPASASDDAAPPLFRGLIVDKKETA